MKFIIITLFLLGTITASAKDSSSGCGPGWFILKDTSLVSSALRATTNGILLPVTTIGMTIGTSNCTKHKIVLKEKESLHFVTHNIHELKSQASRGEGPHLTALSQTIGCNPKSDSDFNGLLKKNFGGVFKTDDPAQVLLETYKIILSSQDLIHACSLG